MLFCQSFSSFMFSVHQVRYWNNGEEGSSSKLKVAGNVTSARLHGLKSNLEYYTAVRAFNSAGTGPFSATVNATTKKTRMYLVIFLTSKKYFAFKMVAFFIILDGQHKSVSPMNDVNPTPIPCKLRGTHTCLPDTPKSSVRNPMWKWMCIFWKILEWDV